MNDDTQRKLAYKKWTTIRKAASLTMLLGFLAVVWGYFYLNDMYPILAIWFVLVIVPHIAHTFASRKLRKLQNEQE